MEALYVDVNWLAVIVGAIVAFLVGWLWYSDKMFATKWRMGLGQPATEHPMWMGMVAQAVATFLLAWVIGITETTDAIYLAILIGLMVTAIVKANGFFAGKSKYAITVESSYVIVMVIVMILAHAIF
ncbi:DUF1761 domain-containing protein [Candidatus Kaiserbacteria bacterium CG10_big_fil_rev_8_21_14_0_10_43_70]|uniref:DUF1761 domain-containing protein n=1 Tax=Candidatus Kaiserbacteria bacterium CG10_big_fil_rev_8_21_14_0_10_43_70 TaxID=1974605 RepID=A0A2H0UKV6_9BACT|nr:MAG: DUF1761 domain-containing protein [Candidatus Kaiserbacteria bacterium CG10_big_fil_rev_8_21_14_0_10_43_70]